MIQENLKTININIAQACKKSGRSIEDVMLVAVSKKQNINTIQKAVSCGLKVFGENYVQELQEKQMQLII